MVICNECAKIIFIFILAHSVNGFLVHINVVKEILKDTSHVLFSLAINYGFILVFNVSDNDCFNDGITNIGQAYSKLIRLI